MEIPNFKEDEVHVRIVEDEEIIDISYILNGKLVVMNRPRDEFIHKTVKRLINNYHKKNESKSKVTKGKKKDKNNNSAEMSFSIRQSSVTGDSHI